MRLLVGAALLVIGTLPPLSLAAPRASGWARLDSAIELAGAWLGLGGALALLRGRSFYRRKFRAGCLCPGQVVSSAPPLLAVYTDLRLNADHPCPALKVVPLPPDQAAVPGQRVATVASYHTDGDWRREARWSDFSPDPVSIGSGDRAEVARALAAIPAAEWVALEAAVASLQAPIRAGLMVLDG